MHPGSQLVNLRHVSPVSSLSPVGRLQANSLSE